MTVLNLKLVNRYSIGNGTPEEIKAFNDFYDLEEARFDHENWIQRYYNQMIACTDKYFHIEYPTFQHP